MLNPYFSLIFLLILGLCSCNTGSSNGKRAKDKTVVVFAAASLTDVMQELAQNYEKNTGVKVKLNLASSGILARQMEQGAFCDIYVSASKKWMDYAVEKKLIREKTNTDLAKNHMVAVVPADSEVPSMEFDEGIDFPSLFTGRLSVGDPLHVPAGMYAMELLESYQWKAALNDRLLPAKDVRDALMMVEFGEAHMGIVYASDAQKSMKVKTVLHFPLGASSPILYYGGLGINSKAAADPFIQFIKSRTAREIWLRNGFNMED